MVCAVAVTPDGQGVVSGAEDHVVRLWYLATGELLRAFEGHAGAACAVGVLPGGCRIVSGSEDKTVRIWDADGGGLVHTLVGHTDGVRAVAVARTGGALVSASADTTVRVWDSAGGEPGRILEGHTAPVSAVAISSDGRTTVSGSEDETLRIWDTANGAPLKVLEGHQGFVTAVALASDGQTVVSGGHDTMVRVWNTSTGELLGTMEGHRDHVCAVAISPDGQLVSGSEDKAVCVWQASAARLLRTAQGHNGVLTVVALSQDAGALVSAADDGVAHVWSTSSWQLVQTFRHRKWVVSAALSSDGRRLVTADAEAEPSPFYIWDVPTGQKLHTVTGHGGWTWALAVSGDTRAVASSPSAEGSTSACINIWSMDSAELLTVCTGHHTATARALVFTPCGQKLVSGCNDRTVAVWDRATGALLQSFAGHFGWVLSVAVSPDGQTVVSGSCWNAKVMVLAWDLATGKRTLCAKIKKEGANGVTVCADVNTFAVGCMDKTVSLWDTSTGAVRILQAFPGHLDRVTVAALSPDGRRVVSGSADRTVRAMERSAAGLGPDAAPSPRPIHDPETPFLKLPWVDVPHSTAADRPSGRVLREASSRSLRILATRARVSPTTQMSDVLRCLPDLCPYPS